MSRKRKIVISRESIIAAVILGNLSGWYFCLAYQPLTCICIGLGIALLILLVYFIENN